VGARLGNARAKLDGAEERLERIEVEIGKGAVTDLLRFCTERDAEGRVLVLAEKSANVPPEWSVWIGEFVHDVRSALDHLTYALNVKGSGQRPPPNGSRSQFPLYTERDRFSEMANLRDRRRSKIGYLPEGAGAFMEALQPYHTGDDTEFSEEARWLWVLCELSNIDKHRRFPITAVFPDLISYPSNVEGHKIMEVKGWHEAIKVGTPIMRLTVPTLPPETANPEVGFAYMGGLNFQREVAEAPLPLVLEQEPVNFVLPSILGVVQNAVIPAFEPLLE
jgi:hypothetical protein